VQKSSYIFDRSRGLVLDDEIEKISKTKVLLIGCGLGSQVATLLARTGFSKFILCDGDIVEKHNLNRQDFSLEDIGKNKAGVVAKRIKSINKDAEVSVIEHFIKDEKEIKELVLMSDIVVNMADPAEEMYEINRQSVSEGRIVFFPMNLGFISFVMVFDKNSKTLEEILGGRIYGNNFYLDLIGRSFDKMLTSLLNLMQNIDKRVLTGELPAPQIGTTSLITSALLVSALLKYLKGEKINTAPKPIFIEPQCQS